MLVQLNRVGVDARRIQLLQMFRFYTLGATCTSKQDRRNKPYLCSQNLRI